MIIFAKKWKTVMKDFLSLPFESGKDKRVRCTIHPFFIPYFKKRPVFV